MKCFFYIIGLTTMIVGCTSKNQLEEFLPQDSELPILLSVETEAVTRSVSYFNSGLNVDVFIKEANNGLKNYGRLIATTDNSHSLVLSPTQYWPAENGIDIYSWYPSNIVGTDVDATNVIYTVPLDQTSSWVGNDLLFGKPVRVGSNVATNPISRTADVITLGYDHIMSKITITLLNGSVSANDLKGAVVSMTSVLPEAQLDLKLGTAIGAGTPSALTLLKIDNSGNMTGGTVLVPPQSLVGKAFRVQLTNGAVYRYIFTSGEVVSGKEYSYTIKLKTTDIEVTSSVKPWEEASTPITGDALMP